MSLLGEICRVDLYLIGGKVVYISWRGMYVCSFFGDFCMKSKVSYNVNNVGKGLVCMFGLTFGIIR